MVNPTTLNRSAATHGRRHRDGLERLHRELPDRFKLREAKRLLEEWDDGTFLKLRHAGLLDNEFAGRGEPKDWYLTQQTRRWLEG